MLEVTHVQLPMDGEIWRCEWFGEVRANPAAPLELEIAAWFRQQAADRTALPDAKNRVVWIGLGAFCSLRLGSLWRDGRLLDPGDWTTEEFFVDFATPRRLPVANALIGNSRQAIAMTFGSLLVPDEEHEQPVLLANTFGDGRSTKRPKVAIPLHEVARGWYLRDSELTLRIMSQPFPYALDALYDRNQSKIVPQKIQLAVRPGISVGSVPIVAMLVSNPQITLTARSLIDRVVAAKIGKGSTSLDVMPPMKGRTRIIVAGEWKEVLRTRTFFVYSLLGVELPKLPPIEWFRADGAHDAELVFSENGSGPDNRDELGLQGVRVTNSLEPSTRVAPRSIFIEPAELLNLPSIERQSTQDPLKRPVRLADKRGKEPGTSEDVSSGTGTSPSEGARSVRFETTPPERADDVGNQFLAAGFDGMIDLARRLGAVEHLRIGSVRGADFLDDASGFARTLMTKKLTWAFIGARRRQALCIEIQHQERYHYVVEVERRYQKEELSSCLLGRIDGKRFEALDLDRLLNEFALKRGNWTSVRDPFWFRTLAHKFKNVDTMADKILRIIQRT